MDSIPASQILFAAAALAGEVVSPETGLFAPSTDTFARFVSRLNVHIAEVWHANRWPEVTSAEEWRLFDARYWTEDLRLVRETIALDPTGANAFVALYTATAAPGAVPWPPALLTDPTKWAQLKATYSADDWLSTKSYKVGDIVRYQAAGTDGRYSIGVYVCTQAAGVGVAPPSPVPLPFEPKSNYWLRIDKLTLLYQPKATVGIILQVSATEPDGTEASEEFRWDRRGVWVANQRASNWFLYQTPAPILTGTAWSAEAAYAVGNQVWWQSGRNGDWYDVLQTTTAGQSPETHASLFSKVEIPRRFGRWLSVKIAGDWLRWSGNDDKARLRDAEAQSTWDEMMFRWEREQKQVRQWRVNR